MKTCKLLFLLAAFSAVTFYSCSDNASIKNEKVTQKSIALRTVLNKLKTANNIAGKYAATSTVNPFCFEFVYPITISFSNGTTATAANFQGLVAILTNESPSLYLDAIAFPFQVIKSDGSTVTISSEDELTALVLNCGFSTLNQDLLHTFCFDIIFPISITHGGQITNINSVEELNAYINNPSNGSEVQLVFPISVLYHNQTVVVNNLYEFYQMINNCNTCLCTAEYVPVCVHTANGIVEYGNFCQAQCAGYTQNDLVPCNSSPACSIANPSATTGSCNSDGTYSLTLNFTYANTTSTQFTVRNSSNGIVGTYSLSSLPITINNYAHVNPNTGTDYLTITMVDQPNCANEAHWTIPNCGCNCPTTIDPVCVSTATGTIHYDNACLAACAGHAPPYVTCNPTTSTFGTQLGSCFHMAYPVGIQYQGAIVTVNSDSELLQYYFPATASMPAFNYPIVVFFANSTYTFANQAAFQAQISASCP